jgi:hypothetical protein
MNTESQAAANLGFVYSVIVAPALHSWEESERRWKGKKLELAIRWKNPIPPDWVPYQLFDAYSLLESALWLQLGLETDYLKPSHVAES